MGVQGGSPGCEYISTPITDTLQDSMAQPPFPMPKIAIPTFEDGSGYKNRVCEFQRLMCLVVASFAVLNFRF